MVVTRPPGTGAIKPANFSTGLSTVMEDLLYNVLFVHTTQFHSGEILNRDNSFVLVKISLTPIKEDLHKNALL